MGLGIVCALTVGVVHAQLNATCGVASNVPVAAAPSNGLCTLGTPSAVTVITTGWTWTCVGSNGGTSIACTAPRATAQPVRPLNDTGMTRCAGSNGALTFCTDPVAGDAGVNPRQDGRYGRDAKERSGLLTKVGSGSAGFDFTKLCGNGDAAGTMACPANPIIGYGPNDWQCSRDNVTGLTWEMKTPAGLRASTHTYTWRLTDNTSNGGNAGVVGSDTCSGTLSAYGTGCNSESYVNAVNAATVCGFSDWRVPNPRELFSLVNSGSTTYPIVDQSIFSDMTNQNTYWTSASYPSRASDAYVVHFLGPSTGWNTKTFAYYLRLVR